MQTGFGKRIDGWIAKANAWHAKESARLGMSPKATTETMDARFKRFESNGFLNLLGLFLFVCLLGGCYGCNTAKAQDLTLDTLTISGGNFYTLNTTGTSASYVTSNYYPAASDIILTNWYFRNGGLTNSPLLNISDTNNTVVYIIVGVDTGVQYRAYTITNDVSTSIWCRITLPAFDNAAHPYSVRNVAYLQAWASNGTKRVRSTIRAVPMLPGFTW